MLQTSNFRRYIDRLKLMLVALCLLPGAAYAWYGGGYPPSYPAYGPGYYSYYPGGAYPGYNNWYAPYGYGYNEPRVYFRGRMDPYGDYEFRVHVENMNMYDMYNAWLWFMNNRNQY